MRTNTSILSHSLPALALCAALLGGSACDNAQAMIIITQDEYTVDGTIILNDYTWLDEDYIYVAAYYSNDGFGAPFSDVAVTSVEMSDNSGAVTFTTTIWLPQGSDIYGYSLIGTYPDSDADADGVCVSFPDNNTVGSPWETVFPDTTESDIYDAVWNGTEEVLWQFASDYESKIATDLGNSAHLIGFSDGKELGTVQNVTFTPVPEPSTIPLLAGAVLLPTLLLHRRAK